MYNIERTIQLAMQQEGGSMAPDHVSFKASLPVHGPEASAVAARDDSMSTITPEEEPLSLFRKKKTLVAGVNLSEEEMGCPRSWRVLEAASYKLNPRLNHAFGPFPTIENARSAIQHVGRYVCGVRLGTIHRGAHRRCCAHGARRTLHCTFRGCPYKATYELTIDDGLYNWYMYSCVATHCDHPMVVLPDDHNFETISAVTKCPKPEESSKDDRLKVIQAMIAPMIEKATESQIFCDVVLGAFPKFMQDLEAKTAHIGAEQTSSPTPTGMKRLHGEISPNVSDAEQSKKNN